MIIAGTSVAELQAFINTELVPLWEQEYGDMIDDLVDQGLTLDQATQIVGAEHGTQADFTSGRTSAIIDPVTQRNAQAAQQAAERNTQIAQRDTELISDGERGREIQTATETLNGLIEAGTSVADLTAFINETLVPLWDQEYQDMIDATCGSGA